MLEIPESKTISLQVSKELTGKKIAEVLNATSHHKFTWFHGDPAGYGRILSGRKVISAKGHGMFVDIQCDDNTFITIGEGANIRYYTPEAKHADKYQLLIVFDDGTFITFNVAMYGGIWAYRGTFDNKYHKLSLNSTSPLDKQFNESLYEQILNSTPKDISAKALLATGQRIPGIGNGVLQDILYNAGIHPRRKKSTMTDLIREELFNSLKMTLRKMTDQGGRDTEKDLFGENGGYKTLLSKNTVMHHCIKCGDIILKEAYLGGTVYFCPTCQKL
jgi:formamidopyrimidine-DNA glycosylase